MTQQAASTAIQIRSELPLIYAGLERAAKSAGLDVVPVGGETTFAVRLSQDDAGSAPVDIYVGEQQIAVTLCTPLGPSSWAALGRFIDQLIPLPIEN